MTNIKNNNTAQAASVSWLIQIMDLTWFDRI